MHADVGPAALLRVTYSYHQRLVEFVILFVMLNTTNSIAIKSNSTE